MNKATCLSLLSNAVLVWNTIQITKIVDKLRARRDEDFGPRPRSGIATHACTCDPNGIYRFHDDEDEPRDFYAAAS
jgi:Tn3 transposase DDE domain